MYAAAVPPPGNNFHKFYLRLAILALTLGALLTVQHSANAQYFPSFGSSVASNCSSYCEAVALATAPDSVQAQVLLAAINVGNNITYGFSRDGASINASNGPIANTTAMYCDATAHTSRCVPTIAVFNGVPYISYQDYNHNLVILKGTMNTGSVGVYNPYTFTQVASLNVGGISTAPQMVVFNNNQLFIVYATNISGYTNAMAETYTSDGVNWTSTNAGLGARGYCAFTQVGLSVLNGVLHMTTEQDNSSRHLFYWSSSDGLNWTGAENSNLYTDSGISMVTYKDNLVMAAKQDNSQNHIYLFSSPDGLNWSAQQYSQVMQSAGTPALALFNGGVSLAYIDQNGVLQGAFASY